MVGIWGQSQGGWLVHMLAGRMSDLSFAIAKSGPSINAATQDLGPARICGYLGPLVSVGRVVCSATVDWWKPALTPSWSADRARTLGSNAGVGSTQR